MGKHHWPFVLLGIFRGPSYAREPYLSIFESILLIPIISTEVVSIEIVFIEIQRRPEGWKILQS
jgi:hypothetical protein